MTWIATAIVGSAVLGVASANKAAKAQTKGYDAATAEQQRQFDLTYADQAPYREAGVNALADIDQLRGGDFSGFKESPGYQFNLEQGMKAIDRGGRPLSGRAVKEGIGYASGLASNEFANYYNRLAGQAGIGQTSVGQTGQLGAQTAGNIGNAMIGTGTARANAYQGYNQALQGGMSNMMLQNYLSQPTGYTPTNAGYGGYNPAGTAGNYGPLG